MHPCHSANSNKNRKLFEAREVNKIQLTTGNALSLIGSGVYWVNQNPFKFGQIDITDKFIDYTYQINRNLIGEAFRKTHGLSAVPEYVLDMRAEYPEGAHCIE